MQSATRLKLGSVFRTLGPQHPRRVPAAIMFADIAGYSAMMLANEAAALEARAAYRAALTDAVKHAGGVVVQHYGDGSLSIFASAAAAADAALAIQKRLLATPEVLVRIGLPRGPNVALRSGRRTGGIRYQRPESQLDLALAVLAVRAPTIVSDPKITAPPIASLG